jgi:protocatechuate 3,4-dioxygenase beta subunit
MTDDPHDRGLQFDMSTLLGRRGLLGLAGLATLAGCGVSQPVAPAVSTASGASRSPGSAGASGTAADPAGTCAEIPEETAGPYPGDGSNGPNVLTQSGIVRGDIRSSFGTSSGVAEGIPLTITLNVSDLANGCAAFAGAAVYLWHCDRDGGYSMYSPSVANENYLRGVQEANASGLVTFQSVFPAAYSGRWPHIHFEVYPSLPSATAAKNKIATSQLALPEDVCDAVYATSGYQQSVSNMRRTTLDSDMVFRDGHDAQLATVTGDLTKGFTATLALAV